MAAAELDDLADRFADRGVTSVFVYTREAHPAENWRHHRTMDDKRAGARALEEHCQLRRKILLDDLSGGAHRAYGILPNMTWIVSPGGIVLYKAAWTAPEDVEDGLLRALDYLARKRADKLVGVYSERLAWRPNQPEAFRAGLERAGPQALRDFYG